MSFPLATTIGRHRYVMELPVQAEWTDSTVMTRWHSHPQMSQHSETQTVGRMWKLIKQNKKLITKKMKTLTSKSIFSQKKKKK